MEVYDLSADSFFVRATLCSLWLFVVCLRHAFLIYAAIGGATREGVVGLT
jgi:hypothetical protein